MFISAAAVFAQQQIYNWSTITAVTNVRSEGVIADNAGNLLLTTYGGNTILKLTPSGNGWVSSVVAGSMLFSGAADGTNGTARFNYPAGLALDGEGNIYVGDSHNYTIRKITPVGTNWVTTTIAGLPGVAGWADGTNRDARFSYVWGVAVDSAGNVYVGDMDNYTIRKITPVGTNWVTSTIAGKAGYSGFVDGTNSVARFAYPAGVAVDSANNVYVADWNGNAIRKITPMGTNWVTTTIVGRGTGSADGTNSTARFYEPTGVALDGAGNLYVSDEGNGTIRKVRPMGTNWVTTTIGGLAGSMGTADGTNSAARFGLPNGVAVDLKGNVYMVDYRNTNLRKGTPLPVFQKPSKTNGAITLCWTAGVGQISQVQFKSDLGSANWEDLGGPITATNETVSASDSIGPDQERVYRVRAQP